VDLTQFEDYDEVSSRFYPETLVPYGYRGGSYALPETMDFQVMFYRKDILSDLNIALPETRKQLYTETLPALYNAGYEFYYPRDEKSFILQYGGAYYTPDGLKSALDTPEVYEALQEATRMYTQYGIPKAASFYNRFRTGEMPIGIGSFSLYLQLLTAAPEIAGRWGIAMVPGMKMEDGTIDRTTSAFASTSDVILNNTGKEKQSWEFLKWWSSEETQTAVSQEIEASLGTEARWNTANIQAFESMAWKKADLEVITAMMEQDREIPNVVGGYYTTRHMTNLWNKVVINGANLRDALEEAVEEINKELRMKQEEYGITDE
jgi:ABC-type glycerol-3-phosphate transport system substrate-binding protein